MSEHQEDYGNLWINRGVFLKKGEVLSPNFFLFLMKEKKSVFHFKSRKNLIKNFTGDIQQE